MILKKFTIIPFARADSYYEDVDAGISHILSCHGQILCFWPLAYWTFVMDKIENTIEGVE
jgi:hypothetical protein